MTGQVGLDRRRTTHPRSPTRAHQRAGLGGTGGLRAHPAGCRSRGTPPVRSTDPIKPPRAWLRRTRQGPGQRPSRIFRQPRSPPRTRRLSRRGRPSSRGIELPCPACRLHSIRRRATAWPGGPATDVAASGVVEDHSEGYEAVPRRTCGVGRARRAVSAGPITANPAHLSQQGPTPSVPIAAHSPAGFRVSSIAEISSTPPQSLARRTGSQAACLGRSGRYQRKR